MLPIKVPPEIEPYYRAWQREDLEALAVCFTEGIELRANTHPAPIRGREGLRAYHADLVPSVRETRILRHRFVSMPGSTAVSTEMTMRLPERGPGRYLVTSMMVFEFDPAGLISRLLVFVDREGIVPMD
ncbi:MAG: nuclear transport factor 2 family protein [Acidobacteria bacterium]|nr:nuclear transport factor 2 family protein [Acidobacteriota bacterium]MBI3489611.1 nuclear transport factor 2 family protein [Acidobacteriota bacterium]